MTVHKEGTQEFTFPSGCTVCELDKTGHHTARASRWLIRVPVKLSPGAGKTWVGPVGQAAVDFATWTPATAELQLIEVKDYRLATTGLPSKLPDIVARKVRDSLATLAIASGDSSSDVHAFARNSAAATKIAAVLDVRLGTGTPTPAIVLADLQQKLMLLMRHAVPTRVAGPRSPVTWTKRDLP
jgi:hypothetical protein